MISQSRHLSCNMLLFSFLMFLSLSDIIELKLSFSLILEQSYLLNDPNLKVDLKVL